MRYLAVPLLACAIVLAGCSSMPAPKIDAPKVAENTIAIRVVMAATNYDKSWDDENLRMRVEQKWQNDAGVAVDGSKLFEVRFDAQGGDYRKVVKLQDSEGEPDGDILLNIDLVSGQNAENQNTSAAARIPWSVGGKFEEKDLLLLAVVSRVGRNNYAIDVIHMVDPATGETVQIYPTNE